MSSSIKGYCRFAYRHAPSTSPRSHYMPQERFGPAYWRLQFDTIPIAHLGAVSLAAKYVCGSSYFVLSSIDVAMRRHVSKLLRVSDLIYHLKDLV